VLNEGGSLERSQFQFILNYNKSIRNKLQNQGTVVKFYRFFFGWGLVQGITKKEIVELQESLKMIKTYRGDRDIVNIILLGITSHWSVLFIHKKADTNEIQITYLDSLNINIFNLKSKDEVINFANQRFEEKEKLFKKKLSEWSKKLFIQWVEDTNFTIRLFNRILFDDDNYSLYDFILNKTIHRITQTFSYYYKIDGGEQESNNINSYNEMKSNLLLWIKNEYHPKVLYEDLNQSIEIFNCKRLISNLENYQKFKCWVYCCQKIKYIFQNNSNCNKDPDEHKLFERFFNCIDELVSLI
jgi:hypothetical protein